MALESDAEHLGSKEIGDVRETAHGSDKDESTRSGDGDGIDSNFQPGIQDIEAVTLTWSTSSLVAVFIMIWIVYFVQGLVSVVTGALLPYVTSAFAAHSLTPTTSVISTVVSGVTNLSIGKTLDIFGRPHGFLLCAVLATVGLIMSAGCNNVEAYAASQVFYSVGINGIGFTLSVFIADTTSLRYRGLIQAGCGSAAIITAWLGGPVSTGFLNGPGWRWAFGMESILVPAVTLPLFALLMYQLMKARKVGTVPKRGIGRAPKDSGPFGSLRYYLREFDAVGLLLISTGVSFFLLPFSLYTMQAKGWGSAMLICFLVFGILLMIAFGIWERFFAKVCLFPWKFLQDRTVTGACLLSFTLFMSYFCWASYFSSILQVVNNLSVTRASYVVQTYTVAGFFFAIIGGAVISYTGHFKPLTIYVAIPLTLLGTGLMIHFREPNGNVGYIVMAQIFISIASGFIMVTAEIAILAAVQEQQYFAISIALVSMCSSIGSSVGLTISAAIWQDVFPKKLMLYLPEADLENLMLIYADITTQLSYPVGSPTRLAIQMAYGDAQKYLFIAGTATWVLGIVGTLLWRDINVIGVNQMKGRVV
ncbi:hypothetical protein BCR34DRAFT_567629 [Clohesyomyces aquaticus]|uniref:Major facilitator superfamily (MFS) profile domain-containing protein n=1 Tax=Clohesyomyces aquaticus TaxID=1231657 RepID=A0A1Y1ZID5_9PLEO|nr:hypothetical protein BCR34DRAFT_567629 [Clohesyomyces aquaticus]